MASLSPAAAHSSGKSATAAAHSSDKSATSCGPLEWQVGHQLQHTRLACLPPATAHSSGMSATSCIILEWQVCHQLQLTRVACLPLAAAHSIGMSATSYSSLEWQAGRRSLVFSPAGHFLSQAATLRYNESLINAKKRKLWNRWEFNVHHFKLLSLYHNKRAELTLNKYSKINCTCVN